MKIGINVSKALTGCLCQRPWSVNSWWNTKPILFVRILVNLIIYFRYIIYICLTNHFRKYIRDNIFPLVHMRRSYSKTDHGFEVSLYRRLKIKPDSRTVGEDPQALFHSYITKRRKKTERTQVPHMSSHSFKRSVFQVSLC